MTSEEPKQETPELEQLKEEKAELNDLMEQSDAGFFEIFNDLYDTKVWAAGAIPAKYKELAGVTVSVVVRCIECIAYHVEMCVKENDSKEELIEAIRLGILTGGSITIPSARYAYKVLKELNVL